MIIGILPHTLRKEKHLASLSVSSVDWPQGQPEGLRTLADLKQTDHLIVYPSSTRFLRPNTGLKCKVSLVLAEPQAIHGKYYALLNILRRRFTFVICRYQQYADKFSNVLAIPVVESWVKPHQQNHTHNKIMACSLIASAKQDLDGHKLRHQIANWIKKFNLDVSLLGRGFKSFDQKEEGLAPYRYSVIIENCQEQGYFTEKLLDCFLCSTMPIYWGCPNIEDYFEKSGMVICNSEEELHNAIINTPAPLSEEQAQSLEVNKAIAQEYSSLNTRLAKLIETTLEN
jgi:hypothetical protein